MNEDILQTFIQAMVNNCENGQLETVLLQSLLYSANL